MVEGKSLTPKCKIKLFSHRFIVEMKLVEKKVGRFVMPNQLTDESAQAQVTEGTIVDMASDAFDYMDESERPKIGDIVHFIKYEGIAMVYNEKHYRILKDDPETVWGISKKYIGLQEDLFET